MAESIVVGGVTVPLVVAMGVQGPPEMGQRVHDPAAKFAFTKGLDLLEVSASTTCSI